VQTQIFSSQNARRAVFAATALALAGSVALGAREQAPPSKPSVGKHAKVGAGVYEIVTSDDAVYVASAGGRGGTPPASIVVLDPKTLDVKKSITVTDAAYGLGINRKTQKIYTSNTRAGSVSVIDLKTGSVVATIKADADPRAHVFRVLPDEDTDTVYVSIADKEGKLWVIDGKTNTLAKVVEKLGVQPTGLALDKAANRIYVAVMGTNEIVALDLKSFEIVTRFPAGGERPTQLAFDAKNKRLFVTNQTTGTLSIIDAANGKLLQSVKTGDGALGVGFNPNTNLIYVANRRAGTVTVIDNHTFEAIADLTAGSLPNTVAIDAKSNATYVTNKAKSGGRGAPPVDDPSGDTVTMIKH